MITILVVGRNDYYGINLHKRTALSLNYFASLCRHPDDEIVYVDCNTPAHELTLVEAIADTLTPLARERLRIFRVSTDLMRSAIGETPIPFSDELSRNVGLRRSNPANQWVLSTNCDLLLMPLAGGGLGELVRDLKPGLYLCPRYNVDSAQWQQLDRGDVAEMTAFCEGTLDQGVLPPPSRPEEWLRFSAVGDFQLAPREQWFAVGGCEEGMKLWGHSDANNARRLNLLNGEGRTPDLAQRISLFHLDHNVCSGSAHESVLPSNDWNEWVRDLVSPRSRNREDWGLRDEPLPEIRLASGAVTSMAILRDAPRQPTLSRLLRNKIAATFWRAFGRPLNRVRCLLQSAPASDR